LETDDPVKNSRALSLILVIGAAAIWAGNAYTIASLLLSPSPPVSTGWHREDDVLADACNRARNALTCRPNTEEFRYIGNFENPFRVPAEAFASPAKKKPGAPAALRVTLTLKGVLLKERPLAILEDASGGTFICGIGEKIQELLVESIESNRVILRGSQGAITLSVKE
jgi:hypothetical protein